MSDTSKPRGKHTTGPMYLAVTAPCACRTWLDPEVTIEYCTLHKAAPMMLEALRAAMPDLSLTRLRDETKIADRIRAAIRAAEGE